MMRKLSWIGGILLPLANQMLQIPLVVGCCVLILEYLDWICTLLDLTEYSNHLDTLHL